LNWTEEYQRKQVSAEQAVATVKPGDRVIIPATSDPLALQLALIARKDELSDIELQIGTGQRELPWYDPSWHDTFQPKMWHILEPNIRRMINEVRGADIYASIPRLFSKAHEELTRCSKRRNVVFTDVSPPNEHGFCSFGAALWDKKDKIRSADISIAEVRPEFIRTFGDNYIHVSEIDYFVPTDYEPANLYPPVAVEPHVRPTVEHMADLVHDGDTLQIGVGSSTEGLMMAGLVDGRKDLGWHSERIPRGYLKAMRENPAIFSGARKTINRGKAIVTAVALTDQEDADHVNNNPGFEFYGPNYVHDIPTIASHDNMVSINSALMVDLAGQVCVEGIGPNMYGGIGGQFEFVVGAALSKGGRSFTVLPATADSGRVSRIVPRLPEGSYVSLPRAIVHYVVTEFGRANLMGKSHRARAQELIAIAHPDFREALRREAERIF